jgi:tetratricopeptide (TPR) repeat protein
MTTDMATLLEQAHQHEAQEAWAEALQTYEQALALDPINAEVQGRLGIVCGRLGRLDEAAEHYQAALKIDDQRLDLHYNLAMLHRKQGRDSLAQAELEEFLSLARSPRDITRGKMLLKEITSLVYEKCSACGSISTLGRFFKSTLRGKVCPRCQPRAEMWRSLLSWGCLGVSALFVAALSSFVNPWSFYLLVNLPLLFLFTYTLIVPHELCHALAAWLTGGKVFEIRIGFGPAIREIRIGSVVVSWGRYPVGGATVAAFPTRNRLALRWSLLVIAGLLLNGALLLLLLPFLSPSRATTGIAPLEAFAGANALVLASNLLPFKTSLNGTEHMTDGRLLLRLFLGKQTVDDAYFAWYVYEAVYALRSKAYAKALAASEAGLAEYPGNTMLKNVQAIALLEMGHPAEALALFHELLANVQADPYAEEPGLRENSHYLMRAILLNNVAYTSMLVATTPAELQATFEQARAAYRLAPWIAHIQGTWGSLLVEIGRLDTGLAHLLAAAKQHDEARGKAANLAHAAIAYHRQGNRDKATATFQKALALDATVDMVKRAQAELHQQAG